MVSLINFKIVDQELSAASQTQQVAEQRQEHQQHQVAQAPVHIEIQHQAPVKANEPYRPSSAEPSQSAASESANFVVTWRELRFAIEPKWHERVPVRQVSQSGQPVKLVLDNLDGSFKSGELTAILGPSGKFDWRPDERIV